MAYNEKITKEAINKLKKLRHEVVENSYWLNREECEYIVDCIDRYGIKAVKDNSQWSKKSYESLKRKINNLQIASIDHSKLFSFKSVRDVLLYFNPSFLDPKHQKKLISKLDKVKIAFDRSIIDELGDFRYCFSCPPRSCKSELITAFIFWVMYCNPYLRVVYVTNSQRNAERLSGKVRSWMKLCGAKLNDSFDSKSYWMIDQIKDHPIDKVSVNGTLSVFTPSSVPQGISADIIIVDDLYKNLKEANSSADRTKIHEGFFGNIMTRRDPNCPVFVISTRYRHDDLIAELSNIHKWDYDNIPAIYQDKNGIDRSYWSDYWSITSLLDSKKNDEFNFQAVYMGNPIPRESALFNNLKYYENNIPSGCSISYGIDLAYSSNTKSDYSVLVKIHYHKLSNIYYVSDIWRFHEKITLVLPRIKSIVNNSEVLFRYGGQEGGIIDLAKEQYKLNLKGEKAIQDKYQRSLDLADNFHNVYFSNSIDQACIDEIKTFSGLNDSHDDVVDALVNAFDLAKQDNKQITTFDDAQQLVNTIFGYEDDEDEDF